MKVMNNVMNRLVKRVDRAIIVFLGVSKMGASRLASSSEVFCCSIRRNRVSSRLIGFGQSCEMTWVMIVAVTAENKPA